MFAAVIVAAGSSRRAGFDKLAAPLGGMPVLGRSVRVFLRAGCVPVKSGRGPRGFFVGTHNGKDRRRKASKK